MNMSNYERPRTPFGCMDYVVLVAPQPIRVKTPFDPWGFNVILPPSSVLPIDTAATEGPYRTK